MIESPAQSAITASWRRSMLHYGLGPTETRNSVKVTTRELADARGRVGKLLSVAEPVMEQLFQTVSMSGCCVVLTDKDGIILHRLSSQADQNAFDGWGLRAGSIWSEENQGTNGIGTCAVEERAILIHKDQHFRSSNIGMTCMGAPVFGIDGQMIAVLDVSSARDDMDRNFAQVLTSLVATTANRIETEYFRASFEGAQIVAADGYSVLGTPLLAADMDDLVIGANRAARRMLGLQDETFATPIPRAALIDGFARNLDRKAAEKAALRKAISHAKGNMTEAARQLGVSRATLYRLVGKHGIDT